MPRAATGNVFEKRWADGETISYGARVYAYGRREKVTFGTNRQGWNRQRAELEAEKIRRKEPGAGELDHWPAAAPRHPTSRRSAAERAC